MQQIVAWQFYKLVLKLNCRRNYYENQFCKQEKKRRLQEEENDIIEGEIQEGSYNSVITRHKRKSY